MRGLSIIVPFVNEWPQIAWTLRALKQQAEGIPFEIIAIDNHCEQARSFGRDRSHDHVLSMSQKGLNKKWLRVVSYDEKLSHWQSKNLGGEVAQYDTLFFCDAHVLPSKDGISKMFWYFHHEFNKEGGTLHMPLTYHILEPNRLIYRIVDDRKKWGLLGYTFEPAPKKKYAAYEVPVMSTCGMMVSKKLFQEEMVWPKIFGIYGGGENYFNYAMAMKGYKKHVLPTVTLFHHGEKRGYRFNLIDFARNRAAAMAIVCGVETARFFMASHQDFKEMPIKTKRLILTQVTEGIAETRLQLLYRTVFDLEEFLDKWQ